MAQELTTGDKARDLARLSARVGSLYAGIERDDRRHCDTLPAPLDAATRKQLQDYRRDVHARLEPISATVAHRDAAGRAIGAFLDGFLNARSPNPHVTIAAYVSTLADQPLFAILQALDDFKNRRVFDIDPKDGSRVPFTIDHAPSAPRLLDQVKKCAAGMFEERHKVTRVLSIEKVAEPEVPAEERERVAGHMRELADALAMKNARLRAIDAEKIRAEAQEARDRAARIKENAARRRAAGEAPSVHDDDFYVDAPKADFAPIEHPT